MNQNHEQSMTEDPSIVAKPKVTAAQIEENCPPRLRQMPVGHLPAVAVADAGSGGSCRIRSQSHEKENSND
jgi:hypothetical protein